MFCSTAGWQTYRNEEFGFELKIPHSWTGYWTTQGHVQGPKYTYENITFMIPNKGYGPACHDECGQPTLAIYIYTPSEWGRVDVLQMKTAIVFAKDKYYIADTHILEIVPISTIENYKGELLRVQEVIYTFSFIEPDRQADTSDWQVYRSEKFGFEIKYPKTTFGNITWKRISGENIVFMLGDSSFLWIDKKEPSLHQDYSQYKNEISNRFYYHISRDDKFNGIAETFSTFPLIAQATPETIPPCRLADIDIIDPVAEPREGGWGIAAWVRITSHSKAICSLKELRAQITESIREEKIEVPTPTDLDTLNNIEPDESIILLWDYSSGRTLE